MDDREVERLRRLRASALRVRAVARGLGEAWLAPCEPSPRDSLLGRGACAAWRVARAVSGRLRAHPHAPFRKDAGVGVAVANGLLAANSGLGVRSRHQAFLRFETQLRSLAREIADVRALTWAAEFNDCLARSQIEIRALLAALRYETTHQYETAVGDHVPERPPLTPPGEWPYLAF